MPYRAPSGSGELRAREGPLIARTEPMKQAVILIVLCFFLCGFPTCKKEKEPFCGDGACNENETCSSCQADCGTCPPPALFCGDGICNGDESCSSCETDCGFCPPPPPYSITLAWDPNPPEEEIGGYRVYMGTASGRYDNTWETMETRIAVGGLQPGITYYFAAKAYRGDQESEFSNEVRQP